MPQWQKLFVLTTPCYGHMLPVPPRTACPAPGGQEPGLPHAGTHWTRAECCGLLEWASELAQCGMKGHYFIQWCSLWTLHLFIYVLSSFEWTAAGVVGSPGAKGWAWEGDILFLWGDSCHNGLWKYFRHFMCISVTVTQFITEGRCF